MTDAHGNVLNRYEYDAFGNFTVKEENVTNRFCFTGEQYDPAGNLYYLRARFYSPAIGRFLNEDTYYGDGLNLYAYCHNNPLTYVDPTGHWCEKKQQETVQKYKDKGYSDQDAETMANYERLREEQGVDAAEKYLQEQVRGSESGTSSNTLYHYTNEKGMNGIVDSNQLNPSLKANNPKDARYGNGQYLSDITPDSVTPGQLGKKFINVPNQYKYTNYVEIDVSELDVVKGRDGVFVIPNEVPLDLTNRIISFGKVGQ